MERCPVAPRNGIRIPVRESMSVSAEPLAWDSGAKSRACDLKSALLQTPRDEPPAKSFGGCLTGEKECATVRESQKRRPIPRSIIGDSHHRHLTREVLRCGYVTFAMILDGENDIVYYLQNLRSQVSSSIRI